jgi:hypothetical protein
MILKHTGFVPTRLRKIAAAPRTDNNAITIQISQLWSPPEKLGNFKRAAAAPPPDDLAVSLSHS